MRDLVPTTVMLCTLYCTRDTELSCIGRRRSENINCFQQLPAEVIDIKEENRLRIGIIKLFEHAGFPALGEMLFGVQILGEEAAFVRDAEEIKDGRNHIQVGDQDSLSHIAGEFLVAIGDPLPEAGNRLAKGLGINFLQVCANLEAFVDLVPFQLPDRNPPDQLRKRILAKAKVDV